MSILFFSFKETSSIRWIRRRIQDIVNGAKQSQRTIATYHTSCFALPDIFHAHLNLSLCHSFGNFTIWNNVVLTKTLLYVYVFNTWPCVTLILIFCGNMRKRGYRMGMETFRKIWILQYRLVSFCFGKEWVGVTV